MSLSMLAQILRERMGLETGLDRLNALKPQLDRLSSPEGWPSFLARLRRLPLESQCLQQVLELVTVGETYFFRDEAQFDALKREILPRLIAENQQRRQLRILSLGCSTGEEPYSLAILLKQLLPRVAPLARATEQPEAWRIQLVGADISTANLRLARQGVYRAWSFRGVDESVRSRYFVPHPEGWEVRAEVRDLVQFVPLNVVEGIGPYVEAMDLILWRNMSIYFSPEVRNAVSRQCERALRRHGYLMVGASEMGQLGSTGLVARPVGETWVYQRPAAMVKEGPQDPVVRAASRTPSLPARPRPVRPPVALETGLEKAQKLADRGRYWEAREACLQLLEGGPDDLPARYLLAQIEESLGRQEDSEGCLREALKLDRDFFMGHFLLGLSHSRRGQRSRARHHLQRARRLLDKLTSTAIVPMSEGRTSVELAAIVDDALARLEEHE